MDAFANLDVSYWQPKDRAWLAQRELQWRELEKLLYVLDKNKKAKSIIKKYFFKGELPDWKALKDWSDSRRHLDLMIFLYAHPSKDEKVLRELRDEYIHCRYISKDDVLVGISNLCAGIGYIDSCSGGVRSFYTADLQKELPHLVDELPPRAAPFESAREIVVHTFHSNERLFELMWPDPAQHTIRIGKNNNEIPLLYPPMELRQLWEMSNWLSLQKPLNSGAQDMIYQYDKPLLTWHHQCCQEELPTKAARLEILLIALYRIHNFNIPSEGEGPRTDFVRKIKALFDSKEFSTSFKYAWEHVKSGGLTVDNVWTNDATIASSSFYESTRRAS